MSAGTISSEELRLRKLGRGWLTAVGSALRSLQLYPADHAVVQRGLAELVQATQALSESGETPGWKLAGEVLFLGGSRVRRDRDIAAHLDLLISVCREAGVGGVSVPGRLDAGGWIHFLRTLLAPGTGALEIRFRQVEEALAAGPATGFEVTPLFESEADDSAEETGQARAQRVYEDSVAATREVLEAARLGRSPGIRRVKRMVQGVVDQILQDETSLLGLTTIRDYDEYTFTHCVNVCIFSVALGRRIGLSRPQLYELGVAALFHDLGKSRIPLEILRKPGALNPAEWAEIRKHPALGLLGLFQLPDQKAFPWRAMLVAYEHHMRAGGAGYPAPDRIQEPGFHARVVAVCDAFDAATSRRSYHTEARDPAVVLQQMRDDPRWGMDPVIVKAFIALMGLYPAGTLVVLDSQELAIVEASNPIPELMARPRVRIMGDAKGRLRFPGESVDLGARDSGGRFLRTVVKTADPDRFGVRVGDYFL